MNSKLFKQIVTKIHWILFVTLAVAILCTVYFYRTPFIYESTVSFFIDDDEEHGLKFNEADPNYLTLAKATNGNRMFHLAKSSEMVDHLVKKFNLYDHYGINPNSPMHYESISARVKGSINIIPAQFNAMLIVVKDLDKYMAAKIANEIYYKLDAMNKEFIVANVERKIKIYNQLLSSNKKQSFEQTEELRKIMDKCNVLLADRERAKDRNYVIADLKVNIASLSDQLASINGDLLRTIKAYEIATTSLQKENLPNLRIISLALPDLRTPLANAISWTMLLSVVAALSTFCVIGILYENAQQLKKFFKLPSLQE